MKTKKDYAISHDIIVCEGATVKGDITKYSENYQKAKELVKVEIIKPYQVRPGLTIIDGFIETGENRALQLKTKEIGEVSLDTAKVIQKHKNKSIRTIKH